MWLLLAALAHADACVDDAGVLDAHLDRWAADAATGRFGLDAHPSLVVRPLAEAALGPREGVTVAVHPDRIEVDGKRVDPDWAVVAIQKNPNITWGLQRNDPRFLHVLLAVDADAPWRSVVAAVDAVRRAHLSTVRVVFATPPEVGGALAPPASPAHPRVERMLAETGHLRVQEGVALMREFVDACPDMGGVLAGLGGQFPENRPRYLADRLAPAVTACACAVDPRSVAEVFWAMDGRERVYGVDVAVDRGVTVQHAPDVPWREAWPAVLAARDGAILGFPLPPP